MYSDEFAFGKRKFGGMSRALTTCGWDESFACRVCICADGVALATRGLTGGRNQSLTTYGLMISLWGQSAPRFCFAFSFSIIPTKVVHSSV